MSTTVDFPTLPLLAVSDPQEASFDLLRGVFDNLPDGVMFVDADHRILLWNRGAERITGYSAGDAVGRTCSEIFLDHKGQDGCRLCASACPLSQIAQGAEHWRERAHLKHRDGHWVPIDLEVIPRRDESGGIVGVVEVFRDASATVALELAYSRIRELAEKDPLTGLANRRQLDELMTGQLELLRKASLPFSVILTDIDAFKSVNDRWGHATGDEVLVRFAETLVAGCRPSDFVGRQGGEEFLVLLPGTRRRRALLVAQRLRLATKKIAMPEGAQVLTSSFGLAEATPDDTGATLLGRADAALYRAKQDGRDCVRHDGMDPPRASRPA